MTTPRIILAVAAVLVAVAALAPAVGLDQALVGPVRALAVLAAIVAVPALLVDLQGPVDQEVQEVEALVRQAVQEEAQADQIQDQEQAIQAQDKERAVVDLFLKGHPVVLQKDHPQEQLEETTTQQQPRAVSRRAALMAVLAVGVKNKKTSKKK